MNRLERHKKRMRSTRNRQNGTMNAFKLDILQTGQHFKDRRKMPYAAKHLKTVRVGNSMKYNYTIVCAFRRG